jgi:hypothetical protein
MGPPIASFCKADAVPDIPDDISLQGKGFSPGPVLSVYAAACPVPARCGPMFGTETQPDTGSP